MKALQLAQPKEWRIIDVPAHGTPGPGDALLRVERVGVCGTDLSGYLGKMPFFSYPRIPGHELSVIVEAVGEGVTHVRPGERCSVEPYLNCGKCYSCRRGLTNCCETNRTLGVMCDGGLAERIILPARKLHPAPGLTPDQCALVETLAIGCHAVDRGAPKPGENVLIIGAGPIVIGQACEFDYSGVQACKALREEGYRVVLVNSNPATIMTDPGMSDRTYIEPITPEAVRKIIEKERDLGTPIDALLPTLGGQTALNCACALHDAGTLKELGVRMIGANREAIRREIGRAHV